MKSQFVVLFLASALGVAAAPIGIMVPAYFYPVGNSYWDSMSNAATRVPLIAILNPDSGPGAAQDANYISAVANLHHAGGQYVFVILRCLLFLDGEKLIPLNGRGLVDCSLGWRLAPPHHRHGGNMAVIWR